MYKVQYDQEHQRESTNRVGLKQVIFLFQFLTKKKKKEYEIRNLNIKQIDEYRCLKFSSKSFKSSKRERDFNSNFCEC